MYVSHEVRPPEDRMDYLGGSDLGAVLGVDEYRTGVTVFREKTGELMRHVDNAHMAWGRRLEGVILERYAELTPGSKVGRPPRDMLLRHPDYPWLGYHPDGFTDDDWVLEAKAPTDRSRHKWGAPEVREYTRAEDVPAPASYVVQAHGGMLLNQCDRADLIVLIGGFDFRIYRMRRDEVLIRKIIQETQKFWEEHVLPRKPPEPTTLEDLEHLFRVDDGSVKQATPEMIELCVAYNDAHREAKTADQIKQKFGLALKTFLGKSSVLVDEAGNTLATWAGHETNRIDVERFREEEPATAENFITTSIVRTLRVR